MKDNRMKTIKFAVTKSLPVLFGYLFLGSAFGIMLYEAGYNVLFAVLISVVIYAGSGQFLFVSFLSSAASLPTVALMTLFVNSRHIFYGLSYVEIFKKGGWRYPFMIFSLTDETYSVNTSFQTVPSGVDEVRARYYIGVFNHIYWIIGSVVGSLAGQLIPVDFTGIDFSMTALFVVIYIDQMLASKNKLTGLVGIISALLCLIIFGADNFLLPSLILTVALLSAMKPMLDKREVK